MVLTARISGLLFYGQPCCQEHVIVNNCIISAALTEAPETTVDA